MILADLLFGRSGQNESGVLSDQKMRSILGANIDKNFVQRLLNPSIFPVVQRPELGPNTASTHLMASNGNTVFPWITQNPVTGELEMASEPRSPSIPYDWRQAQKVAESRGDTINFDNEDEAIHFGENYKRVLDQFANLPYNYNEKQTLPEIIPNTDNDILNSLMLLNQK